MPPPRTEPASADAGDRLTRRQALARLGLAGLGIAGASATLAACQDDEGPSASTSSTSPDPAGRPNVLLIVADDMRYDHLEYMPNARRLIADEGRAFEQARCNVPLCQPSRVGLLTGQASKDNHEYGVGFFGTELRDHDNTIGAWMQAAGYRCGFFGKYVNFTDGTGGIDAPQGWDTWREITKELGTYSFDVHRERDTTTITGQYPTDYLAAEALEFLGGPQPFFCVVTPREPHDPFRPRRDLADKWSDVEWPIVDEVDVSDKPAWIQALPPLTDADKATIRADVRGALRELSAVDDMVERVMTGMPAGTLRNTVVLFTSDNGVHHGEHRRQGAGTKAGPYEVGLHVPLLARGPGFEPGAPVTVPSLAFQDIAATILAVGGADAGLPQQTGTSLARLCAQPERYRQRVLLHEIGDGFERQTGEGVTTGPDHALGFRKLYRFPSVRLQARGPLTYEVYDLDTDPDELSNWADDPARRDERDALEAQLDRLWRG